MTQRNPSQCTIDVHTCVSYCTVHNSQDVGLAEVLINAREDKAGEAYYTVEFYSSIQRDRMMSFAGKWSELESTVLMK